MPGSSLATVYRCYLLCAGVLHFVWVLHTVHGFPMRSLHVGSLRAGSHCVRGPIILEVPLCVTPYWMVAILTKIFKQISMIFMFTFFLVKIDLVFVC